MTKTYEFKNQGLSGIINQGNTCYLNSFVQCLSNTLPLTKFILLEKDTYFDTLDLSKNECRLVKEWFRLMDGMWEDNCIVSPNSFKRICLTLLEKKMGISTLEHQSDMFEFMIFIIDSIHNGLSRTIEIKPKTKSKKKILKDAVESWVKCHEKDYSEIIEIFYGQIVNYIKDQKNNKVLSYSFQPMCYLTLEIDKENPNLISCLDLYFRKELMTDDNQYNHENTLIDAEKSMEFWKLPNILIIVLKRFDNFNNKISCNIDFPFTLDMAKYSRLKKDSNYSLYAVCNHMGNALGGHYNAYCKNLNDNWYKYDDHSVNKIETKNVISSSAYCLFYSKCQ